MEKPEVILTLTTEGMQANTVCLICRKQLSTVFPFRAPFFALPYLGKVWRYTHEDVGAVHIQCARIVSLQPIMDNHGTD